MSFVFVHIICSVYDECPYGWCVCLYVCVVYVSIPGEYNYVWLVPTLSSIAYVHIVILTATTEARATR